MKGHHRLKILTSILTLQSIQRNAKLNAKMKKVLALKNAERNLMKIKIKNGLVKRNALRQRNNVKKNANKKQKAFLYNS